MNLVDLAFKHAKVVLQKNVTERGFSACSVADVDDPNSNYRSVWARDAAMTALWCLPLQDAELTECGRQSLQTILDAQSPGGHLPNYVELATGRPEFGGVGNIAGIDGVMWTVIAAANYLRVTGDQGFVRSNATRLELAMNWLRAHDSNNCGLLEIPEAADWMDLFPRSYNVLYDEVLWYRANVDYVEIRQLLDQPVERFVNRAARIRNLINTQYWPTPETIRDNIASFAQTQFTLGQTRYLISQITPFGFSWRCDVFANIIASLYGVIDEVRARRVWRFLHQSGVDSPYPVRVLYPAINPGDADWRDYFLVNLLNLPHHYHNGGIWPFVGGLWVRFLLRLGERSHAESALRELAELCRSGIDKDWEFTEWAHGQTGRPMGNAYQAWSAASFVAAYLSYQGDKSLDVAESGPDEVTLRKESGLPAQVTNKEVNLDRPDGLESADQDPTQT
jgi:glycogen debranching enzyme